MIHHRNMCRLQTHQKTLGSLTVKFWVRRLNQQEELIPCCKLKPIYIEHRMDRSRQAVTKDHSDDSAECRKEDGHFERDRNKLGPAVQRPSADVDRVINDGQVI